MEVFWLLVLRLIHVVGGIVWAKAAASDVFASLQKEDWPVLHAVQLQGVDFSGQTIVDLRRCEGAARPFCYYRVSPKTECE